MAPKAAILKGMRSTYVFPHILYRLVVFLCKDRRTAIGSIRAAKKSVSIVCVIGKGAEIAALGESLTHLEFHFPMPRVDRKLDLGGECSGRLP